METKGKTNMFTISKEDRARIRISNVKDKRRGTQANMRCFVEDLKDRLLFT
ncbi:contactin-associated protein like 5-3 precursor [Sesbania bispinosa]|nr:contactin-associated protein like 5-3 precursor [Sesbania bispinosa]